MPMTYVMTSLARKIIVVAMLIQLPQTYSQINFGDELTLTEKDILNPPMNLLGTRVSNPDRKGTLPQQVLVKVSQLNFPVSVDQSVFLKKMSFLDHHL